MRNYLILNLEINLRKGTAFLLLFYIYIYIYNYIYTCITIDITARKLWLGFLRSNFIQF